MEDGAVTNKIRLALLIGTTAIVYFGLSFALFKHSDCALCARCASIRSNPQCRTSPILRERAADAYVALAAIELDTSTFCLACRRDGA
jgi:hypothetical protein